MGEVEQRRDARVERLERPHEVAGVHVLGAECGRDLEPDAAEVVQQGPVGADAAHRGLPRVAVRVHEARQHQRALGIHDARVTHRRPLFQTRDQTVLDHDVDPFEAPLARIADQHPSTPHHRLHRGSIFDRRCSRHGPQAPRRSCA